MKDIGKIAMSKIWQVDLAGLGVFLLLSLGAYWIGVVPLIRQAEAVESQKQQLVEEVQHASKLIASRRAMKKQLAEAQQAIKAGAFELQAVKHLNHYLARLTDLATASQLTLHEIQPGEATQGEHYWSVPVMMSGTGYYRTCAQFLHQLHETLPDTRLSSLKLSVSAGDVYRPAAKFRFGLVWHAAPDEHELSD